MHIWSPLKNEKLYVKTGIIYSAKPYWKKDNIKKDKHSFNIKIPVSLQYVFGKRAFKPTIAFGYPTGIFLISSLQGGFIYTFSDKFELSLNASVDGLLALPLNLHEELYNNQLGHSLNLGLIYNFK
ncbi:MAG: hypothetical protein Kow00127_17740 [Bacteroidales bacterium]